MSRIKYLKCECRHCGSHIEFPVDAVGLTVDCPHCAKQTELFLPAPPDQPDLPRRTLFRTLIALVILGVGLAGALAALKRAQRLAAARRSERTSLAAPTQIVTNPPPEAIDPAARAGFRVSAVTLEKTPG